MIYLLLSIAVFGAAERAGATSCDGPPWDSAYLGSLDSEEFTVAVDAHPWRVESCYGGASQALSDCVLTDEETEDTIAVEASARGTENCDVPYEDLPHHGALQFIRTFTPAQPLTAGHAYRLDCNDNFQGTVHVREDAAPAAAPAVLELVDPYYSRDGNGCCGWGDSIDFRIGDPKADYLRDGGYIEATYADGYTHVLTMLWNDGDDTLSLPATRKTIALTPVSATGERGETVEIDGGEIDGDLVYIPCTIAARTSPAALWMLVPFFWIAAHGRRRRRAV